MPSKVKKHLPTHAPKAHVRKGDLVVVLTGKTRGKQGTILKMFPLEQRALLDGEAAIYDTKHVKPNPQAQIAGGRTQKLRPIHISNLALVDPTTGKATRVRHEKDAKGKTVRVSKKSGHIFVSANV